MKLENETKVTVKSAEVARAILAAIMPNATPEKSSGYSISARAKKQNYFFEDVERELAYCEAYENDCETLKLFRICDFDKTFFVTIEIDSINGDDTEKAIEKICLAAGIEKVNIENSVEKKAEVKKFEVGKIYEVIRHGNSIYSESELVKTGETYEVVKHTAKFVTLKHTETGEIITRKFEVSEDDSEISKDTEFAVIGSLKFLSADNVIATAEKTDPNAELIACIDDYFVNNDDAAEVEEVNAENAKAAEKVAFFENLKETHDGKIFIDDVLNAWNLATCTLGKLKKNNTKTTNAGYTVLENSVGDWVSVLNDRFEVNLTTGQTFNIWTDSAAIENAKNYAWDEVEENIFHAKNADEKTFWLNVCKAKFVKSLITLGVKDLVAAEIIREEEIIACIDEYRVDVDAAAEVEIENAENAAEVDEFTAEKIEYLKGLIATEKRHIASKKESIATKNKRLAREEKEFYAGLKEMCLEKMIWAAREIGEILDQIESETECLEEYYKYIEGYKKDLYKEYSSLNAAVAEIDVADYAVSVEAQEVAVDAEFENAKNEEFNKVPKFDTQTNEKPAVKNSETIYLARTGAYTYELENGEGLDDYYFKQKIHAAIKNGAKVKIRNGLTYYGWIDFSPSEMNSVEICDVYRMDELGDRIDNPIAAIIEYPKSAEVESVNAEPSEKEIFQAKIAEIKNRKHKSCIDWDTAYNDFRIEEIFNLQKDFKKFLKLGEMKRAESVFENLKHYFKVA